MIKWIKSLFVDEEVNELKTLVQTLTSGLEETSHKLDITRQALLTVVDKLGDGLIVCNSQGVIVLANQEAHSMFEYEKLVGKSVISLLPYGSKNEHCERIQTFFKDRAYVKLHKSSPDKRYFGLSSSGEEFDVSVCISRCEVEGEKFAIQLIRDERKWGAVSA